MFSHQPVMATNAPLKREKVKKERIEGGNPEADHLVTKRDHISISIRREDTLIAVRVAAAHPEKGVIEVQEMIRKQTSLLKR